MLIGNKKPQSMPKKTKAAQGKPTITAKGKVKGRPAGKGRATLPPKSKALLNGKPGKGRPTKYTPLFEERVIRLFFLGMTDEQVCESLQVDTATFYRWQIKYPHFREAVNKGKANPDDTVEASLYHRAIGYNGMAPDPASMFFWLKNRRKDQWRDKQEIGFTNKDGEDLNLFELPKNGRNDNGIETKSESSTED